VFNAERDLMATLAEPLDEQLPEVLARFSDSTVSIANSLSFCTFEKADEALLNDYEEVISQGQDEQRRSRDAFSVHDRGMIAGKPVSIDAALTSRGSPRYSAESGDSPSDALARTRPSSKCPRLYTSAGSWTWSMAGYWGPSSGASVPEAPMNICLPSGNVMSRAFARSAPSFDGAFDRDGLVRVEFRGEGMMRERWHRSVSAKLTLVAGPIH
jgi:hypothetical protein